MQFNQSVEMFSIDYVQLMLELLLLNDHAWGHWVLGSVMEGRKEMFYLTTHSTHFI